VEAAAEEAQVPQQESAVTHLLSKIRRFKRVCVKHGKILRPTTLPIVTKRVAILFAMPTVR
jgi:hypothetical protein